MHRILPKRVRKEAVGRNTSQTTKENKFYTHFWQNPMVSINLILELLPLLPKSMESLDRQSAAFGSVVKRV